MEGLRTGRLTSGVKDHAGDSSIERWPLNPCCIVTGYPAGARDVVTGEFAVHTPLCGFLLVSRTATRAHHMPAVRNRVALINNEIGKEAMCGEHIASLVVPGYFDALAKGVVDPRGSDLVDGIVFTLSAASMGRTRRVHASAGGYSVPIILVRIFGQRSHRRGMESRRLTRIRPVP